MYVCICIFSDYTPTNNVPGCGSSRKSTDSHAKISPIYVTDTVPKQYYDNQVQNVRKKPCYQHERND